MAVVAAWKLHMELHTATNDRLSHLQFRREIAIHLWHARPFVRNHPGPRSHLPIRLRTSYGHYFQSCAQGRCAPKCQCSHLGTCQKTLTQGEPNSASKRTSKMAIDRARHSDIPR
ncbi:hypothetical protein Tsp_11313 [Trichinella spiralis]|uniref:hypothetical protein n=1 Tax=Trichinella spiralis TaxID=6334 RepID=UPI0001EFEF1E|nr:hypothetical protein Tsp_11313 [Trichinella spiralis]